MLAYIQAMTLLGILIMAGSLLGVIMFLWLFRPFAPWKHGRMGAHLIYMFWSLGALFGVSLLGLFISEIIHPALAITITDAILVAIFIVIWQRVDLYRDFKRGESDHREEQFRVEEEDT